MCFFFTAKFSVYDGMVFPEKFEKEPSTIMKSVKKFGGAVVDYFTGHGSERDLVIRNHEQVQEECLHVFLENHRRLLTDLIISKSKRRVTYSMCVNEICTIFYQLRIQRLCKESFPIDSNRVAEGLAKVCWSMSSCYRFYINCYME